MRYLPHLLVGAAVTAGAFALLLPILASGDEPGVSKPDATVTTSTSAGAACGSVTFESPDGGKLVIDRGMCSACVVHCAQAAEHDLERAYAALGSVDDEAGAPILGSAIECARACTDD